MKVNRIISLVLGMAVITTSCTVNEPTYTPELPAGEYVRLSLSGGDGSATPDEATRAVWDDPNGSGNLGFTWDKVELGSSETSKLNLIISNGTSVLTSQASSQFGTSGVESTYSGLAVTPDEGDAHRAALQTVRYYDTNDLKKAKYFYSVAGKADITADTDGKQHICSLDMPSTFTQVKDQDPTFLRDYMYMYATTAYNGNGTTLNYAHIPATFRFIISNGTESTVSLQSVSVSMLDGSAVASKSTDVKFGWTSGKAELAFNTEGHAAVTTLLSDNGTTLEKGKKYTAYSMALPLSSNDAFKDKALNFCAKTLNGDNISYILDGETLAKANGTNIYNWIGGKSYTIKINLGEGGKTTGAVLSNMDITVSSAIGGAYTLKYVDTEGEPLSNYADICTLAIDDMATYEDFIDANIAPYTADAIGIFDEAGVKVGSISINGIKADNTGLLYSVGMLSDVHLNTTNSGYSDCFGDFENALQFFNNINVDFICTCGDISEHGTEEEFARYKEMVESHSPSKPVYTTTGNHDCLSVGIDEELWRKHTGQGLTFEVSKTLPDGKTDHFLFFGMSYWNFVWPYTLENIEWLEIKLEEYRNERCFVITHLFFPDRAGNMLEIYPNGNWLRYAQLDRLHEVCDTYKNSIWFSGHSHWKWSLQEFDDIANICRNPESGWSVHIPSCAKPSDSNGTSGSRFERTDLSEGAVINVYENHIDVLGVDFITGKYLPIATYRLDTALQKVEENPLENEYLKASNFEWYKGSKDGSITDIEGMEGYIDVTFTEKAQGWYMKTGTFIKGEDQAVAVYIKDCQAFELVNNEWVEFPVSQLSKVGFYSGEYHLTATNKCYVNEINGVQFQTSSSYPGPLPLKLRMRVRAEFYVKE